MYSISKRIYNIAKQHNLIVKPSTRKHKKIDVYDNNNNYICSIGNDKYNDFHIYLKTTNKEYAEKRRRLYILRHKKDISKIGSKGYYAYLLLWS